MEKTRIRLIIQGYVQGVWFRESTRRQAASLGVNGWVRNRPDGTVEVLAEGDADSVRRLVAWCHRGPSGAQVTAVREIPEEFRGEFSSFEIRF